MIVQLQQQQVQKMTPTTTRWQVRKVNRENRKENKDTVLLCFVRGCNVLPHLPLTLILSF